MPANEKKDLPGTLQRSPAKARRTYAKTLQSAEEQYEDESRAQRTAYSALKHGFEKVGDHWEPKGERGPSDPQAKQTGARARHRPRQTAGGVDVEGNSKAQLMARARAANIRGRSKMNKLELGQALARKQG